MFRSYLILAFRNLIKNKVYAAINIIGLAVALASTFYILIYIVNEFSYNDCYLNKDRVYRVIKKQNDSQVYKPLAAYCFTPLVKENFRDVDKIARIRGVRDIKIKLRNEFIDQNLFISADQDIFDILSLPIIKGTNNISDKNSIVISKSTAKKCFGSENPVNKILEANILGRELSFKISGVMKDIPQNSTFQANILCNIQLSLDQLQRAFKTKNVETEWGYNYWATYLLLSKNVGKQKIENQITQLLKDHEPENSNEQYALQNIKDIYLHSEYIGMSYPKGDMNNIYLYLIIGLAILLIASSNYIILSSALSNNRSKEIAVRKVSGATKKNIVYQILGESILLTFLSLTLAILLVKIFYPYAQKLFDYKFDLLQSNILQYFLGFLIITIIVGIISGLYVSIYLSSFQVVDIMRNNLFIKKKGRVRKLVILFQLIVFIVLVFASLTIYKQNKYLLNKDLGFDKNNLLFIYFDSDEFKDIQAYIDQITRSPNIISAAPSVFSPPSNSRVSGPLNRVDDPSKKVRVEMLLVGDNFIETLGLKILKGNSLSSDFSELNTDVVFNESAIKALGVTNPIGKKVGPFTIVGVVKDFNLHSLHSEIPPMGIELSDDNYYRTVTIRYKKGTFNNTIAFLKDSWQTIAKDFPFEYKTIDQVLAHLYKDEETLFRIISFFTILAILLSASGLFGLTLFTLKKRTKEIGIRRVLGASFNNIIYILSREFLALIIIANIISLPIGYYLINKWLQDFAYKINIGLVPFITSTIIVLVIGLGAISIQTSKAALVNPVNSLRDE